MRDGTKMREIRHRMGQAEDAIDAVHGSLAHTALEGEWRDEFCTDLVVIRTKLEAIAGVLAEPVPGGGVAGSREGGRFSGAS